MSEAATVKYLTRDRLYGPERHRVGERRLGEAVVLVGEQPGATLAEKLAACYAGGRGCRFCVVTVPEDLGPRANLGRGGAAGGPGAFLEALAGMQSNRFFSGEEVAVAGPVDVEDLVEEGRKPGVGVGELRDLTERLDRRVEPVIKVIFKFFNLPFLLALP